MQEYVTEAVVLDKVPYRDLDARYSFFTKRFGKVVGKATSARKITSKLAGHLEPGTVATVRFVERSAGGGNGGGGSFTQVVDALKDRKLDISLPDLRAFNLLLHEGEPDAALWGEILGGADGKFSWLRILRILGWDPAHAVCESCGREPAYFHLPRQEFFCAVCASKLPRNELLLVVHAEV
jgi:DNA repair protein RecO (recombination protein O)